MGAYDDIEASPRSPTLQPYASMLGRHMGDARRKIVLFIFLAAVLLMGLVAFRRQDEIGEIIQTQKNHWKGGNVSVSNNATEDGGDRYQKTGEGEESGTLVDDPFQEDVERVEEVKGKGGKGGKKGAEKDVKGKGKGKGKSKTKGKEELSIEDMDERLQNSTETEEVKPGPTMNERKLFDESLLQLRNETLGFEQIYVLNMAGRPDKLDAMRLSSSLTGFNFEVLPAVSGADISPKALSADFRGDREEADANGVVGCYRGHMNFAQKVIETRQTTALILEDDADWDVNFRSQLEYIALGAQALLSTPSKSTPHSPYGDGWDLIWLGHCASQPTDGDARRVLIKNDKTVTPPEHRTNWGSVPDMWPRYDNSTRLMYFTKGSTCTYAYAVSFQGAQKMIKWMSMDIYNQPIDFGLHDMCQDKQRNFRCIGVFPQIIGDHKPAGGANKDSDIGSGGKADNVREKGFSYNVVHSTRLNAQALIEGMPLEKAESQWPEEMVQVAEGGVKMEWRQEEVEDTVD